MQQQANSLKEERERTKFELSETISKLQESNNAKVKELATLEIKVLWFNCSWVKRKKNLTR